jgi:hypothetical protein
MRGNGHRVWLSVVRISKVVFNGEGMKCCSAMTLFSYLQIR